MHFCDIGALEAEAEEGADPRLFADDFETGHSLLWEIEVP